MAREDRPIFRWMAMATLIAGLALPVLAPVTACAQEARSHVVRPGETLFRIATTYGITVAELKRLNGLTTNTIRAGQRLVVSAGAATVDERPVPPATKPTAPVQADPPDAIPDAPADSSALPALRPGEGGTLLDVAFRYGLAPDTLRALNPDLPVIFGEGDVLFLPKSLAMRTYRVRRGDTLFRIATNHGTTVAALRTANGLERDQVNVGQVLRVPGGAGQGPAIAPVRGGESLPPVVERGPASVYPARFAGRLTSSGVAYDPERLTVAHGSLEIGTVILVTDSGSGRSTLAEVNDRLPLLGDRILEVSAAVAREIRLTDRPVTVRIIDPVPAPR